MRVIWPMRNLHQVGVDKAKSRGDSGLVSLGQAIKDSLGGRSQAWLAEQIDIDPSVVSRIISGQIADLTVERVVEIEEALELTPGTLFRAGGYISDEVTVLGAIAADRDLTPEQKRTLRNVYELAINSAATVRPAARARKAP